MKDQIENLLSVFTQDLGRVQKLRELEEVRIKFLGRQRGLIRKLFEKLPKLNINQKRQFGPLLNKAREKIKQDLVRRKKEILKPLASHWVDLNAPGKQVRVGHLNPLSLVLKEIKEIFHYLGFNFVDGPEVENDVYNFQKLLLPPNHPSRDAQQTYYLNENLLLRTHTSPMQIRFMEQHKPPIRIISPGRVFRRDQIDATHLPNFMQFEGLLVEKDTNLPELIGTISYLIKEFFGKEAKMRVYGHHFPYTEPSLEIEMFHPKIDKWIEMGGCGMVHPDVLRNVDIDPGDYRGWAFGMGLERFAMIKYGIDDIRLFYSGDYRFLEKF